MTGPTRGATEDQTQWASRPWTARAVRFVALAVPFCASLLATWAIRMQLPSPDSRLMLGLTILALMLAGIAVAIAVERLTRRWLPLASLLESGVIEPAISEESTP